MKILFVVPIVPYPLSNGTALQIYNLLRVLGPRHRIHLVIVTDAAIDRRALDELRPFCEKVDAFSLPDPYPKRFSRRWSSLHLATLWQPLLRYWDSEIQRYLDNLAGSEDFDGIWLETSKIALYGLHWKQQNVIVLRQNDELKLTTRLLAIQPRNVRWALRHVLWYFGWWFERRLARRLPVIAPVSESDAEGFRRLNPDARITVIANGVDVERYRTAENAPELPLLLFTGTMAYSPNRDAVEFFCREILPIVRARHPAVVFRAMGFDARRLLGHLERSHEIEIVDHVNDTRPALTNTSVFVVPLRAGSGTRLKILEAMAMGKAIVSTAIGCEGIDLVPGEHLVVADNARDFASEVVRLIGDREERRRLGRNARLLVESRYDWRRIGNELERLTLELSTAGERRVREAAAVNFGKT